MLFGVRGLKQVLFVENFTNNLSRWRHCEIFGVQQVKKAQVSIARWTVIKRQVFANKIVLSKKKLHWKELKVWEKRKNYFRYIRRKIKLQLLKVTSIVNRCVERYQLVSLRITSSDKSFTVFKEEARVCVLLGWESLITEVKHQVSNQCFLLSILALSLKSLLFFFLWFFSPCCPHMITCDYVTSVTRGKGEKT